MQKQGQIINITQNGVFDIKKRPHFLYVKTGNSIFYILTHHNNYKIGNTYTFDVTPIPTAPLYFEDRSFRPGGPATIPPLEDSLPLIHQEQAQSSQTDNTISTETIVLLTSPASRLETDTIVIGNIFYVNENRVPASLKTTFTENTKIRIETKAPLELFPQQSHAQQTCKFPKLEFIKAADDGALICRDPRELSAIPGTDEYNARISTAFSI